MTTIRIQHWTRHYRLRKPHVLVWEQLASGGVLTAFEEALKSVVPDDREVVLLRQVALRFTAPEPRGSHHEVALQWGRAMATAVREALERNDPANVRRYPTVADHLVSYLEARITQQHAEAWYFARLRGADPDASIDARDGISGPYTRSDAAQFPSRSTFDALLERYLEHWPEVIVRLGQRQLTAAVLRRVSPAMSQRLWSEGIRGEIKPNPHLESERPAFAAALRIVEQLSAVRHTSQAQDEAFQAYVARPRPATDWSDPTHLAAAVFAAVRYLLDRWSISLPSASPDVSILESRMSVAVEPFDWLDREWLQRQLTTFRDRTRENTIPPADLTSRTKSPHLVAWEHAWAGIETRLLTIWEPLHPTSPHNCLQALSLLVEHHADWVHDPALAAFVERRLIQMKNTRRVAVDEAAHSDAPRPPSIALLHDTPHHPSLAPTYSVPDERNREPSDGPTAPHAVTPVAESSGDEIVASFTGQARAGQIDPRPDSRRNLAAPTTREHPSDLHQASPTNHPSAFAVPRPLTSDPSNVTPVTARTESTFATPTEVVNEHATRPILHNSREDAIPTEPVEPYTRHGVHKADTTDTHPIFRFGDHPEVTDFAGIFLLARGVHDLSLPKLARQSAFPSSAPEGAARLLAALGCLWNQCEFPSTPDRGLLEFARLAAAADWQQLTPWRSADQSTAGTFQSQLARILIGLGTWSVASQLFVTIQQTVAHDRWLLGGDYDRQVFPWCTRIEKSTNVETMITNWCADLQHWSQQPVELLLDDSAVDSVGPLAHQWKTGASGQAPPLWMTAGGVDCNSMEEATLRATAASVLRHWARSLRGLGRSSSPYLLQQLIQRPGTIRTRPQHLEVTLASRPLDAALQVSGMLDPLEFFNGRELIKIEFQVSD